MRFTCTSSTSSYTTSLKGTVGDLTGRNTGVSASVARGCGQSEVSIWSRDPSQQPITAHLGPHVEREQAELVRVQGPPVGRGSRHPPTHQHAPGVSIRNVSVNTSLRKATTIYNLFEGLVIFIHKRSFWESKSCSIGVLFFKGKERKATVFRVFQDN